MLPYNRIKAVSFSHQHVILNQVGYLLISFAPPPSPSTVDQNDSCDS